MDEPSLSQLSTSGLSSSSSSSYSSISRRLTLAYDKLVLLIHVPNLVNVEYLIFHNSEQETKANHLENRTHN